MNIVLIKPPTVLFRNSITADTVPPIGLAYLASSLKQAGHKVVGIDALMEGIDNWGRVDNYPEMVNRGLSISEVIARIPTDSQLIGISSMFSGAWPYVRQVMLDMRRAFPDVPIVAGGEHITAMPKYVLDTCPAVDYCIKGEGERSIVMLANTLCETTDPEKISQQVPGVVLRIDGKVVHGAAAERIKHIDSIPAPDWTVFPIERYLDGGYSFGMTRGRSMPIIASRGCPYRCTFCSSPQMWTTLWKARSPDAVVNEMKGYIEKYNVENFDFYDLTAIVKKQWIIEFCKKVIKELPPIKWQLPSGTRTEAIDVETANYLYKSGCCNISYAPESANLNTLKSIKKKVNPDNMLASMRAASRNNIKVKANIIIGFPGERKRDTLANTWFLIKMAWVGAQDAHCYKFSPYPGSELFRYCLHNGSVNLNDDYFYSLFEYTNFLKNNSSYSEYMPPRFLNYCAIFNMAIFYSLSLIFRPVRIWHLFNNLVMRKQPVSYLEMAVFRLVKNIKRDRKIN